MMIWMVVAPIETSTMTGFGDTGRCIRVACLREFASRRLWRDLLDEPDGR
jgi:hypothetical protein